MVISPWDGGTIYATDAAPRSLLVYLASGEREDAEALFHALEGSAPFALAVFRLCDWNSELSPWPAEAVFGDEGFSGHGCETLSRLESALPAAYAGLPCHIGGYSLAGLFALWALHESRAFSGCAAVSASFWYPGLPDYVRSAPLSEDARIYLSLGKKESKSRNRQMRTVAAALNELYEYYASHCVCTLEWNEGNHFTEPLERMRRGFAWLLEDEGTTSVSE